MIAGNALDQRSFVAALLDPGLACPEGLVTWNGSDPAARFSVYRNNVVSSLIDALADTFPVVQELVGEEFFRAMAARFVRQSPPRSRVLAHYGADFPTFIDAFEPAQSVPYLADVARLELARVHAYHAADAMPVAREAIELALASGERIGELRLELHPCVSVVRSKHAIVSIWAAHQGEGDFGQIDPGIGESALVVRSDLDVLVLTLAPAVAQFATAVLQGQGLADAAQSAIDGAPDFDLSAALALLLGRGAVTSIHLPRRASS
ncbi:MAG: DNA-binding domain-containing protein [Burkholderiales bacterium]